MFVRATSYRLMPEFDNPEGRARICKELSRKLHGTPGLKNAMQLGEKDAGRYIVVAVHEDEASANQALEAVRREWDDYGYLLSGPLRVERYASEFRDS